MNKFQIIIPPNVPYSNLLGSDKQFAIKLRKEIPIGPVSILTYVRQFCPDWSYNILDLNIIYSDMQQRKLFYDNPEDALEKLLLTYLNDNDGETIIGISALFNATFTYLEVISKVCRKLCPNAFIFMGGALSNLYREVFATAQEIDAISFGEGELPIYKYMIAENKQEILLQNNAWITRDKIVEDFIPGHDFIENLDEIPTLDYSLVDFEKYTAHVHSQTEKQIISAPLMFSRGCPFNCCFCASHSIHGKRVRYNSLTRIINDIRVMQEKYNINSLVVWDDNFFVDKDRAFALLDECEKLNITIEFANSFPIYRMDEELIVRLKRAGVETVSLAIESGCQRVLNEVMHKGHVKLDKVKQVIQLLRSYELYIVGLFVIGLPGETREEIQETIQFIKSADLNWVSVFSASPVAGSELYDVCKEGDYLDSEKADSYDFYTGCISTEEFTSSEIEEYQIETSMYCNLVNNWDMRHGNYERALLNFMTAIKSNPDNPLLYYYASKCADKLERTEASELMKQAKEIYAENDKWTGLVEKLQIDLQL